MLIFQIKVNNNNLLCFFLLYNLLPYHPYLTLFFLLHIGVFFCCKLSVKRLFNYYYSCDLSKGQASKKISNECRIVQHTGLQSTQTRRNTGQVSKGHSLGTSYQASLHQWLQCMSYNNQAVFFVTLNISVSYNYHAATDVGMLGKMCRVSAPCLPVFLLVCVLCMLDIPSYIHLI